MFSASSSSRPRPRVGSFFGLAIGAALVVAGLAPRTALAQPAATDWGSLTTAAPFNFGGLNIGPPPILWFKFTISAVSPAMFLDIDTSGSTFDTMIGLYDNAGNRVASDDDSGGSGGLSQLSFGVASPARAAFGSGLPFQGQNGPLVAGTYYLALAAFPTTFGPTGWTVTSTSTRNGTGSLHLRLGPPGAMPIADAGFDQTAPEGTSVTLDGAASSGGLGCPTQLTWTQIAGPAVVLNLSDPVHPTFTAPQVSMGGATLTFRLDVNTCPSGTIAAIVNVTVTNINSPPHANAGPNQTVTEASPVVLDGSASFDPDNDPLAFAWTQSSGPAVTLDTTDPQHPTFTAPFVGPAGAVLTFALGVSDGLATASALVSITVDNVNHPPVANAGPGGTFNATTVVTLDASASSDPDSDPLTFSWQQLSGPAVTLSSTTSPTPSFTAPTVGAAGETLVFRVTVGDGSLASSADVTILIHSNVTPPDCSMARPSIAQLWPPNHRLEPIFIRGVGDPCHNPSSITILSVTQDEPIRGLGDGDTGPDAVIIGPVILLRAERAGNRNGRVYRINFRATNAGGSCTSFVTVTVPHDKGHNGAAIDDGQLFNSVGP